MQGVDSEGPDHHDVAEDLLGVELEGLTSAAVVGQALDRNVSLYPGGSGPSVNEGLLFAPPLIVNDEQVDRIVEVTAEAIDAATEAA